jgi:hypothetical protein
MSKDILHVAMNHKAYQWQGLFWFSCDNVDVIKQIITTLNLYEIPFEHEEGKYMGCLAPLYRNHGSEIKGKYWTFRSSFHTETKNVPSREEVQLLFEAFEVNNKALLLVNSDNEVIKSIAQMIVREGFMENLDVVLHEIVLDDADQLPIIKAEDV